VPPRQCPVRHVLHRGAGVRRDRSGLGSRRMSTRPKAAPSRGGAGSALRKPVDLSVRVGPMTLRNPVLTASGTFGYGDEYAHVVDLSTIGGVVTKTVTVMPRPGNAPARVAETPAGMLNSIGLENVGLERFRDEKLPRLTFSSPM